MSKVNAPSLPKLRILPVTLKSTSFIYTWSLESLSFLNLRSWVRKCCRGGSSATFVEKDDWIQLFTLDCAGQCFSFCLANGRAAPVPNPWSYHQHGRAWQAYIPRCRGLQGRTPSMLRLYILGTKLIVEHRSVTHWLLSVIIVYLELIQQTTLGR